MPGLANLRENILSQSTNEENNFSFSSYVDQQFPEICSVLKKHPFLKENDEEDDESNEGPYSVQEYNFDYLATLNNYGFCVYCNYNYYQTELISGLPFLFWMHENEWRR